MSNVPKIQNVATNIISGFLGVGKTTAILSLFANKPATEKWAVLVNEFGKIGIDGQIYQSNGITVKEIPGGCICCAQGLPMLMAVNRLLQETKPDRLIIESSGIGHPAGVLKTLTAENFKNVLTIKAGICLVDARHLLQAEYHTNDLFKEQLQIADILVANKIDLADDNAVAAFKRLTKSFSPQKELIATTNHGVLNTAWLDYPHVSREQAKSYSLPIPQSNDWQTHSFQFSKQKLFNIDSLIQLLNKKQFTRVKGFIQTKEGCCLVNYANGQVHTNNFNNPSDNYIEIINNKINIQEIENELNDCI